MTKQWTKRTGYKGKTYWVRGDLWACCILEDILQRRNRFFVMVLNRRTSAHTTLARAKSCANYIMQHVPELLRINEEINEKK